MGTSRKVVDWVVLEVHPERVRAATLAQAVAKKYARTTQLKSVAGQWAVLVSPDVREHWRNDQGIVAIPTNEAESALSGHELRNNGDPADANQQLQAADGAIRAQVLGGNAVVTENFSGNGPKFFASKLANSSTNVLLREPLQTQWGPRRQLLDLGSLILREYRHSPGVGPKTALNNALSKLTLIHVELVPNAFKEGDIFDTKGNVIYRLTKAEAAHLNGELASRRGPDQLMPTEAQRELGRDARVKEAEEAGAREWEHGKDVDRHIEQLIKQYPKRQEACLRETERQLKVPARRKTAKGSRVDTAMDRGAHESAQKNYRKTAGQRERVEIRPTLPSSSRANAKTSIENAARFSTRSKDNMPPVRGKVPVSGARITSSDIPINDDWGSARVCRLVDELRHAYGHASTEDMADWATATTKRLGFSLLRRVRNLGQLGLSILDGLGGGLVDIARAVGDGHGLEHVRDRAQAAGKKVNTYSQTLWNKGNELSTAFRKDPATIGVDLLVAALAYYYVGGGIDGDGGIPDKDIVLFGIGGHRSIWTHSIFAGAVIETSLFSLYDLLRRVHSHLPSVP